MSGHQHPRPLSNAGDLRLRCVRCGTDLRSLSIKGNCPTCSLAVRSSVRVESAHVEAPSVCGRCGYDLRGLASEKCPECGASIAESARRAAPAWERAIEWFEHAEHVCPECGGMVADGRCLACQSVVLPPAAARREPGAHPESRRVLDSFDREPIELVLALRQRAVIAALVVFLPVAASLVIAANAGPRSYAGTGIRGAILGLFSMLAGPLTPMSDLAFAAVAAVGAGFAIAGWLLTVPVDHAVTAGLRLARGSRPRRIARVSALLWLAVTAVATPIALRGGVPGSAMVLAFGVAVALALFSLAPLNLHLRNLAAWLVDEKAEHFFNVGLWGALLAPLVPIGVLVGTLGGVGASGWGGFLVAFIAAAAASVAYYGTASGLLLLAASACWSVVHARKRLEQDRRRLEKAKARFAQDAERVAQSDPTAGRGRPRGPAK